MRLQDHPKEPLSFSPTPLHPLERLRAALGAPCALHIKRDDQTGLALGGNKTRKLEYLMGDALAAGADVVVTAGAAQSNHCRQTAAAAARLGLGCHLLLGGAAPPRVEGNLLLDHLLGAEIHWAGEDRTGAGLSALEARLRAAGRRPYLVPYGGSNGIGALGFVEAMRELRAQRAGVTHVVFASSSGGTHAGLMVGAVDGGPEVLGVRIDKADVGGEPFDARVARIAREAAARVGVEGGFSAADVRLDEGYLGGGYGVVGEAEREAIALMARREGILVDPVYTGRALAGLIGMIRAGRFTARDEVVFWHTGGTPALFAYGEGRVTPS